MGFSGGGEIFNAVAQVMVRENVGILTEVDVSVLRTLARELMMNDWDTVDESMDEFSDHPMVLLALHQAQAIGGTSYTDVVGHLDYVPGAGLWVASCDGKCDEDQRWTTRSRDGSAESHDAVVHRWLEHDHEKHGGSAEPADRHWLILDPYPSGD